MQLRRPIVSVLGHVDHGKTALLDSIRESDIRNYEPGGITQHVEVTNVPSEVIESFVGSSYDVQIPGFVLIDTPGHGAFTLSRQRGGEYADIAVLVIDVTNGVQPQTEESLEILRKNETPFVVALNKIDKLPGWNESVEESSDRFKNRLRELSYEITGELHEFGFSADMFDNIDDFSNTVAMVPVCADTGYGLNTLSTVIVGLTQEYLSGNLEVSDEDDVRGVVMDVTNHQGFGTVGDVLLYEGRIREGDSLYINDGQSNVKTTVRSILVPEQMTDSRRFSESFVSRNEVTAATFARLALSNDENLGTGCSISNEALDVEELEESLEYDDSGVMVCADTTGSLAAVVDEMTGEEYRVNDGKVGAITKFDVTKVATMPKEYDRAVVGFNVEPTDAALELADEENVEIITDNVIHSLVEKYEEFYNRIRFDESMQYQQLRLPARVRVLEGFVINNSNPAIVGVEVKEGELSVGSELVQSVDEFENGRIGRVERIEVDGESVESLPSGERGSVSISGATVGRDFDENDTLLTRIPEKTARYITKRFDDEASPEVMRLTEEIKEHKQEWNPFWGV